MSTYRTDPRRLGIRARLLALLLPGILGLLALDSWNDYNGLHMALQDAHDSHMLESAKLLRNDVSLALDGSLKLAAPALVKAIPEPPVALHKQLHVALRPKVSGGLMPAKAETNLLGAPDLPSPPRSAKAMSAVDAAAPVWYNSVYKGEPYRLLNLESEIVDGHGQHFDMVIRVAESTVPQEQAQAASLRQQFIRDVRMVVVVVLLLWFGVTWSLRPLEELRKSVLERNEQDLQALDTRGVPHEVAPLVDTVNQHVANYRELLNEQSRFLAEASHQLRTPLAIMLMQAGVALREENPEQLHATLRAMVVQISRSRRLCEQLLSLAHASDIYASTEAPRQVDLSRISKEVVLQYLTLAHEKNQDLGWIDVQEPLTTRTEHLASPSTDSGSAHMRVPVIAHSHELHEVLSNLVHNAIVYTPAGGQITVFVSTQEGLAQAVVQDNGPGIAPSRREQVFKRFHQTHRENGSTGSNPNGAGLGLPIARTYARRNGGEIELTDLPHGDALEGLRAILRLPLARATG